MKTKKSKLFKTISFSSLALLMGIAGTMAFAPLGASPSVANANELETTTEQGLITPKADDPVIYTTESGLEIKWGNALPSSAHNNLSSGNLKWFPYFTTTNGSTTYTWVIIGRNPNLSLDSYTSINQIFSTWKTNSTYFTNGSYFFNNTYETATPAGSAINGIVPSKSYVADYSNMVVPNAEIPSGCVLALSNASVGNSIFCSTPIPITSTAQCFGESSNTLTTTCKNYYTNDTFGFGSYLSSVQSISLKQRGIYNSTNNYYDNTCSLYFFPLGFGGVVNCNDTTITSSIENFQWTTYLTATQYKTGGYIWARSMYNPYHGFWVNGNGVWDSPSGESYWANTNRGVRPACVVKLG